MQKLKTITINIAILCAGLSIWLYMTGAMLGIVLISIIFFLFLCSWCAGSLLVGHAQLDKIHHCLDTDIPKITLGLPLFVSAIYVCSYIFTVDVLMSYVIVAATLIGAEFDRMRKRKLLKTDNRNEFNSVIFLVLLILITTIWCQDALVHIYQKEDHFVISAWQDVYYHLAQISSVSRAENLRSLQSIQMAGFHAKPYHTAGYILPAVLSMATGVNAWSAYAGFMIPLGLILTGFAAYTLIVPWYGHFAGMVAGLGILILPDAAQLGFSNGFFSYHWLQQIAPAGMYGIVTAVCAFQLIMIGIESRLWRIILISYIYLGAVLLFKAHIFVAVVYPILVMPALFWQGINTKKRIGLVITVTLLFLCTAILGQLSESVPTMRLDGSSLWDYSNTIRGDLKKIWLLNLIASGFYFITNGLWVGRVIVAAFLLILVTFPIYIIVLIYESRKAKNTKPSTILYFPFITTLVFLIMSLCLSYDKRGIGMPEELLHRPFVWAYFCVVVPMLGLAANRLQNNFRINSLKSRLLIIAPILLLMYFPIHFSNRIQTMPIWNVTFPEVDVCVYKAAEYVKFNSPKTDIVLTQGGDPNFQVTALTERQAYATDSGGYRSPEGLKSRVDLIRSLETSFYTNQLVEMFLRNEIHWYFAKDISRITWSDNVNVTPKYTCGKVAIYSYSSFDPKR